MAVEDKNITYRIYLVAFMMFLVAIAILVKLTNIEWTEGDYYRKLAKERTVKNFVIPANKGNIYSADGSLLATSIPSYKIRFDAMAAKKVVFEKNLKPLSDSLSVMLGKPSSYYENLLRRSRAHKNRFLLVARDLSYTQYIRIKNFPLFELGPYKGGIITEQKTVREHPIGKIAERTIGYERTTESGQLVRVGIEGAFGKYLNGKDGRVLKQKIAQGQWKPLRDNNEVEPNDGYVVVSTIDVYIQDIAHHALLKQLEYYEADHGCVIVMETETGHIKAISNLGRDKDGSYYETVNYAVAETQEPGSTFKLMALTAMLEDKVVDTSTVFDSFDGVIKYSGRSVRDSKKGGYGKVSLARGFELSSNTILVQAMMKSYESDPKKVVNRFNSYGLNQKLGLPFQGEGHPHIPQPNEKLWSKITLPWMGFGYGVSLTPLQTLTFYNAIANNGRMVKPQFITEVKAWNRTIKKYETEVINPQICSQETIDKVQAVLANVIKRGTGSKLYSKDFSMAGKTGTAQVNYGHSGGSEKYYSSSFAGYFPAENPKYSCIVIVHEPNVAKGYYGGDVSGPVFKRIAQKIFTDSPSLNEIENLNKKNKQQEASYSSYFAAANKKMLLMPNLHGMNGMDAVALLENQGFKVKAIGNGKVKTQSIKVGASVENIKIITIELI